MRHGCFEAARGGRAMTTLILLCACPPGASSSLRAVPEAPPMPTVNYGQPPAAIGQTPAWVGVEGTFTHPQSNMRLYLARMGVDRVRVFTSYLGSQTLAAFVGSKFGRDLDGGAVGDAATFVDAVNGLRRDPKGSHSNPLRWAAIDAALSASSAAQDFVLGDLVALAADPAAPFGIVPNLYLTPSKLDITSSDATAPAYWAALWEYYKYIYSLADWCIDHKIVELEMENEPNLLFADDYGKFRTMFLVSALALRHVRVDKAAPVTILGPTLTAASVYSPFTASVMADFRRSFAGFAAAEAGNFDVFTYHRYDGSGPLHASIATDYGARVRAAATLPLPLFVTEMNAHTALSWAALPTNADTPAEMANMASQVSNLVGLARGMILFAFGQRPNAAHPSGVNKNGVHTLSAAGSPYNVGSATRSAEAYVLFARSMAGEKTRVAVPNVEMPSDAPVLASYDGRHAYVFAVNDSAAARTIEVDFRPWKFSAGTPGWVARVDADRYGDVAELLSAEVPSQLTLEPNAVLLAAMPRGYRTSVHLTPLQAVTLAAGSLSQAPASASSSWAVGSRADGQNSRTHVGLLSFDNTVVQSQQALDALLTLTVATPAASPRVLHVYAFAGPAPDNVSWTTSGALLPLAEGQKMAAIVDNVVNFRASPTPLMLGSLPLAPADGVGSRKRLEVGRAVRAFAAGFSLLFVREVRSDGSDDDSIPADGVGDGDVAFWGPQAPTPDDRPDLALQLF